MQIDFNRVYCSVLIIVFLLLTGHSNAAEYIAPLHQNSRFPALFMFLTPSPDSPDVPNGRLNVFASIDYTSIFINEETDDWEVLIDFEFTTVSLALEMRLTDGLAVSAETSFVRMGKGFLDGFLNEYHKAGGFPDYDRPERPNNEFGYYIREANGPYWFRAKRNRYSPIDSVVSVKFQFVKERDLLQGSDYSFSSAVKYSLKLPTGDVGQGLSSDGYDHGFFLLTKFSKNQMNYYLNPGFILLDKPETSGASVDIANMATLFAGATYLFNERWTLIAQLNYFSSPFDMNIHFFDNPGLELTFGFNYKHSKRLSFEFAFSEDLAGSVPDFTVHSGLTCNF